MTATAVSEASVDLDDGDERALAMSRRAHRLVGIAGGKHVAVERLGMPDRLKEWTEVAAGVLYDVTATDGERLWLEIGEDDAIAIRPSRDVYRVLLNNDVLEI